MATSAYRSGDTVHLVVDEAIRCIHLTTCLAVRTVEGVLSFECRAAPSVAYIAMHAGRELGRPHSCEPSKLSGIHFSSNVGRHIHHGILRFGDIIVSNGQRAGLDSDLDISIDSFAGDCRSAEARVDSRCLSGALIFDTAVLEACDVAVGSSILSTYPNENCRHLSVLVHLKNEATIGIDDVSGACRCETKCCICTLAEGQNRSRARRKMHPRCHSKGQQ